MVTQWERAELERTEPILCHSKTLLTSQYELGLASASLCALWLSVLLGKTVFILLWNVQ